MSETLVLHPKIDPAVDRRVDTNLLAHPKYLTLIYLRGPWYDMV